MPSPFPGMDPWIEAPVVWADFHDALAGEIRAMLNQVLPQPYYAQLGIREEMGIVGDELPSRTVVRRIVPDVSIEPAGPHGGGPGTATAVLAGPRMEVTESFELTFEDDPQQVDFVEIHDVRSGREVVTVIEILSPSNKRPGPDHEKYVEKRREVLGSTASLIEIDLLRAGRRDFFGMEVSRLVLEVDPPAEYLVLVQRAWRRRPLRYQIFPGRLTQPLPVIAVPLREEDDEVSLDLQYAFQQTYDRGPYRRGAVNYNAPPNPPLPDELQTWAEERLAAWRGAGAALNG